MPLTLGREINKKCNHLVSTKFAQALSCQVNDIVNATIVLASKCSHKNVWRLTNNLGCVGCLQV
jgi:hypothetical protein